MPSMKIIRRRLGSVTTTKKIMKAMHMVAAAKLQKDKARLEAARPFCGSVRDVIEELKSCPEAEGHRYFQRRAPVRTTAYLVITSDRGLCGGYNTNVAEAALLHMDGRNELIVSAGLRGRDYFKQKGKRILEGENFGGVSETAFYEDALRVSRRLADLYTSGAADEVYVAYTKYLSALTHECRVERLLPLDRDPKAAPRVDMRYEGGAAAVLEYAAPLCLSAFVYAALLESSACEQAARMMSMDAAVDSATEIGAKLTRMHNRVRQAAITREIGELVGSAEAHLR